VAYPYRYDKVYVVNTLGEPIPVVDSGINTNPELYKVQNGFRSAVIARAGGVATPLWTLVTNPVRTAGMATHISWIALENATGAAATAWLEIGGVQVSITVHLANLETALLTFPNPLPMGDSDIDIDASANGVTAQIGGYEV